MHQAPVVKYAFPFRPTRVTDIAIEPITSTGGVNTLRPRQNGRHFPEDIFKCIFLNENVRISIKISLKFVPRGPMNDIPALVQIMVWRRQDDKPLSEPMLVSLLTHICVTRPQWVIDTLRPRFYQTGSAWSMDQGSNRKHSAVHNFAPTVTKFCVMWEGQALPHDTKFSNCRCEIVGMRVIFMWSLIPGSSWSGLIKAEPGGSKLGQRLFR